MFVDSGFKSGAEVVIGGYNRICLVCGLDYRVHSGNRCIASYHVAIHAASRYLDINDFANFYFRHFQYRTGDHIIR